MNHYNTLGIEPTADAAEIKRSFRRARSAALVPPRTRTATAATRTP